MLFEDIQFGMRQDAMSINLSNIYDKIKSGSCAHYFKVVAVLRNKITSTLRYYIYSVRNRIIMKLSCKSINVYIILISYVHNIRLLIDILLTYRSMLLSVLVLTLLAARIQQW